MASDPDRPGSTATAPETVVPASTGPAAAHRRFAWPQAILSAVIGGVIALALLFVLASLGIAPSLEDPRAGTALQTAESLQAELATVSTALAALKSAGETDDTPNRIAKLAERTGGLEDRVAALAVTLDQLKAQLAPLVADDAPDPTAMAGRLDDLAAQVAALTASPTPTAPEPEPSTDSAAAAAPDGADVILAALAAAAEAGEPFQPQLDLLARFGVTEQVRAPLRDYADGGTATRAALIAAYPEVEEAILAADREARRDSGFFSRLFGSASGIVSVRPTGPIAGDSAMAVVSRMTAWIEGGHLAAALSERRSLPEEGQAASADWAEAVAARLALDAAVKDLAMAVDSNADSG